MLVHNPFAGLAQVIAPSRLPVILPPPVKRAITIAVPLERLGLRTRSAAKRSTSREIQAVLAEETRRGARRSVL
jgi:hypothetical protein